MSHLWGCGLCPSGVTSETDDTPDGWHVVECIPICPQHEHDHADKALAQVLHHFPRYFKLSSAGGMYWLTEVNGVPIREVRAHTSPYGAVMTWAQEKAGISA